MRHSEALDMAYAKYVSAYRRDLEVRYCVEAAIVEYIYQQTSDIGTASDLAAKVRAAGGLRGRRDVNNLVRMALAELRDILRK